jgi:hypothetical protein
MAARAACVGEPRCASSTLAVPGASAATTSTAIVGRYVSSVNWHLLNIRTSLRLAGQDTIWAVGARVHSGASIAVIAVIIGSVVTHHLIAIWTVAAYPIYLLLAWCAYTVARLRGWNRLWKRDIRVSPTETGPQINASLAPAHPETMLTGDGYEIDCWVTDPAGTETKGRMASFRFRAHSSYPGMFAGVTQVVPGTCTVIWREQKPPTIGKWRVIDAARVTVTKEHMHYPPASELPAAGSVDENSIDGPSTAEPSTNESTPSGFDRPATGVTDGAHTTTP